MVARKPFTREHEVSRKAIAQGRPECSRCPVCSCALLFAQIARETAGAASTRSSLRPLTKRAGSSPANLGQFMSRDRSRIFNFHRPRRRAIQMLWGSGGEGVDTLERRDHAMEHPMSQSFDASRSLTAFEQDSTL